MKEVFPCVFELERSFATINADPGRKVYNEHTVKTQDPRPKTQNPKPETPGPEPDTGNRKPGSAGTVELRIWDPFRSKLCGAMKKGLKTFPFAPGTKILYLGASTGTTISHLSDIVGDEGEIYAVEIAAQCMKSLIALSDRRHNIIPIHADARQPQEYEEVGQVDAIYMDVAQPDQDDILIKNAKMFLKKGGIAMIAIKSQSIDVTKDPSLVFDEVVKRLEREFDVLEKIRLEPYDKDHLFVVLKYNGQGKG